MHLGLKLESNVQGLQLHIEISLLLDMTRNLTFKLPFIKIPIAQKLKVHKFHTLFRPQLDLVKNQLTLNYEHETPLTVNLNEDTDFKSSNMKEAKMCTTKICKDLVSGHDTGLEATEWLERVTGLLDLRLVRVNSRSSEVKSAANDAQFLILNLATVKLLKQKAFFVHCYLLPYFFCFVQYYWEIAVCTKMQG